MARMYAKDGSYGVTAFTVATADILDELGSGTLKVESTSIENSALMDEWEDGNLGRKVATFTGELACDTTENVAWWTVVGTVVAMVFTDAKHAMSGNFRVESAELSVNDAMRWNVTMKSKGAVTSS